MVLVLVILCVGASDGLAIYYFGYWALFKEVVHLGKYIGHVVCTMVSKELYTMSMFNVQLQCQISKMQLSSGTHVRSKIWCSRSQP